tara:strand:+ start:730 stop:1140 length:411 start_codon:yes stop_codon:yes gene_type:complete
MTDYIGSIIGIPKLTLEPSMIPERMWIGGIKGEEGIEHTSVYYPPGSTIRRESGYTPQMMEHELTVYQLKNTQRIYLHAPPDDLTRDWRRLSMDERLLFETLLSRAPFSGLGSSRAFIRAGVIKKESWMGLENEAI